MTPYNKDKTLSTLLILLTLAVIIFGIGTSDGVQNLGSKTLNDIAVSYTHLTLPTKA